VTFGRITIRPECNSLSPISVRKSRALLVTNTNSSRSELMIFEPRPSSPCYMMGLVAGLVCNIREAGMQAFVDQKPHPPVSVREISCHGIWCHEWRGGRPLRG
jgi:hypothetical protein